MIEIAVGLCKRFEGFRAAPYLCPAGVVTQGYGSTYKPDGNKISMYDPSISEEVAEDWLLYTLMAIYLPGALKASPVLKKYPKSLSAIVSFCYNLGVPRYRASTLRQAVNEEDWDKAKAEIVKWKRAGGKVLPGLVIRRNAEALLLGE